MRHRISPRPVPFNTPRHAAIHEAAHAVAGIVLGTAVESVSIRADHARGSAGRTRFFHRPQIDSPDARNWQLMASAVTDLAGHAATQHLGHDAPPERSGAAEDYRNARRALQCMAGPDGIEPLLAQARDTAADLVAAAWPVIEVVADELEAAQTLTGAQVMGILDRLSEQ